MDLIIAALSTALSSLLVGEFRAWVPRIVQWIVRHAVARLPEDQRNRYEEEWESHLNDVPGEIGKLSVALGFFRAACRMASILKPKYRKFTVNRIQVLSICLGYMAITLLPPLLCAIFISELLGDEPVIERSECVGIGGKRFIMYRFNCDAQFHRLMVRLLGKTKLDFLLAFADNLPSFINFIRGDMALVGPRAWNPQLCDQISEIVPLLYSIRTQIKPGIFGWAQSRFEKDRSVDYAIEELQVDVDYVKRKSPHLDFSILRLVVQHWRRAFPSIRKPPRYG